MGEVFGDQWASIVFPDRGSTSTQGSSFTVEDGNSPLAAQPSSSASPQSSQLNSNPSTAESLSIDISVISSPSLLPSLPHSQPSQTGPLTSTPKASPVVRYPIQRARLGSLELFPPPNEKYPVLKVLPLAKQLVVECSLNGEKTDFVIKKENTTQVFFCRFKNGGHLVGWDPLPTTFGSFDSYRTLHLVMAKGTLNEWKFSCQMSKFFKTSFQVVL